MKDLAQKDLTQKVLAQKKNILFVVLSSIFLVNTLLAEIIGTKIFSLEALLGYPPAQWSLFGGQVLSLNLTAGVLVWPIVFITTDVINEYFGKRGVRQISLLTAALIAYGFLVIYCAVQLPAAAFWVALHGLDAHGHPFDIAFAFGKIFTQSLGIIIGSLVAFLIGQFLDVFIFQRVRRYTGKRLVWLRATGSTLVSQLIDSFIVLYIAFYLAAPAGIRWPMEQVFSVAFINYLYKGAAALLLTPLIYLAHHAIKRYLGVHAAEALSTQASQKSRGFF